jgi:chorismate mutase
VSQPFTLTSEIPAARRQIDDIDRGIVEMLRLRQEISHRVQRTRLDAGGQRIDGTREASVTAYYRSALGAAGADLAAALLRICRG